PETEADGGDANAEDTDDAAEPEAGTDDGADDSGENGDSVPETEADGGDANAEDTDDAANPESDSDDGGDIDADEPGEPGNGEDDSGEDGDSVPEPEADGGDTNTEDTDDAANPESDSDDGGDIGADEPGDDTDDSGENGDSVPETEADGGDANAEDTDGGEDDSVENGGTVLKADNTGPTPKFGNYPIRLRPGEERGAHEMTHAEKESYGVTPEIEQFVATGKDYEVKLPSQMDETNNSGEINESADSAGRTDQTTDYKIMNQDRKTESIDTNQGLKGFDILELFANTDESENVYNDGTDDNDAESDSAEDDNLSGQIKQPEDTINRPSNVENNDFENDTQEEQNDQTNSKQKGKVNGFSAILSAAGNTPARTEQSSDGQSTEVASPDEQNEHNDSNGTNNLFFSLKRGNGR
ncbi:MAG: hypothetical protein IJU44_07340, partial [Kiritimatiellae bacterium]|nr:hypothetical protein [Kiritimatiellia bacterium]